MARTGGRWRSCLSSCIWTDTLYLPAWYRRIRWAAGDLFVSASTSETQGLTYLEALRAGLPLLCRRDACLDGVAEQGVNGWQYTEEDDFAACVEQFLTHPEHREQMERSALASG